MEHTNTPNINDQLVETMMNISRLMRQHMVLSSPLTDLTMLQFESLSYIKKNGKVQMKDISNYFQITKPTATSLLTKLARLKLVKRLSDKNDRRIVYVTLTDLGEDLFENIAKERTKKVHTLLATIDVGGKKQLLQILQSILDQAKKIYEK